MHQVIVDRLEEYLSGSFSGPREFMAHLDSCEECRTELRQIQEISGVFAAFRAPERLEPAPGFYARLTDRLDSERPRSQWSLFSLDPAFGKRVAFASLMTLALLGSYLVSRETEYSAGPSSAAVVMAEREAPQNPDVMLATLAAYQPEFR